MIFSVLELKLFTNRIHGLSGVGATLSRTHRVPAAQSTRLRCTFHTSLYEFHSLSYTAVKGGGQQASLD